MWQPFLVALQFLTRLPVRVSGTVDAQAQGKSLLAYPLVGLIIGALIAVIPWLLSGSDALIVAALMLTAWVLITGALHLDGLADSADAWLGGQGSAQRTLEIMKDPHAGPAAVVLVVLVLVLKFAALAALVEAQALLGALLVPMVARATIVGLLLTTPYARAGGLGEGMAQAVPVAAARGVIAVAALLMLLGGGAGLQALACGVLASLGLRALMMARIGGTTGDTAGAMVELNEAVMLTAWALALP